MLLLTQRNLCCAQCGRMLADDPAEVARWRPRILVAEGDLDELTAMMVLCPDCADDASAGAYDAGDVD